MDPDCQTALKTIAENFLEGQLSPLEAACALAPFEYEVGEELTDSLTAMSAVASETDDIPLGETRKYWHPEVRDQEDRKHDRAQAWAEPIVREACERLIRALR